MCANNAVHKHGVVPSPDVTLLALLQNAETKESNEDLFYQSTAWLF